MCVRVSIFHQQLPDSNHCNVKRQKRKKVTNLRHLLWSGWVATKYDEEY